MTILDIEPAIGYGPSADPFKEIYDSIVWISELADLVTIDQLQDLADRLTRLTDEMIRVASTPTIPWQDQTAVLDFDLGSRLRFKRSPYEDALGAILRIQDLIRQVSPEDFGYLAYRLGHVTNDVVMAAKNAQPRPRMDRRAGIYELMQAWTARRQCGIA